ncbi:hypothetical protein LTR50_002599 [Elasticomyces elasticus]|nr:hypothetical protein LTR50_002599 [Elasticomyces elasticus]
MSCSEKSSEIYAGNGHEEEGHDVQEEYTRLDDGAEQTPKRRKPDVIPQNGGKDLVPGHSGGMYNEKEEGNRVSKENEESSPNPNKSVRGRARVTRGSTRKREAGGSLLLHTPSARFSSQSRSLRGSPAFPENSPVQDTQIETYQSDSTEVNKQHIDGGTSGTVRPSRFQEGSLSDRPSAQPPSLFLRSNSTNTVLQVPANHDELMSDYHGDAATGDVCEPVQPTSIPAAKGLAGQQYRTPHANSSVFTAATVTDTNSVNAKRPESSLGGVYRFGRSIATTFNPASLWHTVSRTWVEAREDLTIRNIEENRKKAKHLALQAEAKRKRELDAQKKEAEAAYATLKAKRVFGTLRAEAPEEPEKVEKWSANGPPTLGVAQPPTKDNSPYDSVRSGSNAESTQQYHVPSLESERLGRAQSPSAVSQETTNDMNAPKAGTKKFRLHIKRPSLTNLNAGLMRVRSEMNMPKLNQAREVSSSLSPEKSQLQQFDARQIDTSTLRKSKSKKELKTQQKLSKRISDLEGKLAEARRELNTALANTSPLPPLPTPWEKYTPVKGVEKPGIRSFVPGKLPSLPSERILSAHQLGSSVLHDTQDVDQGIEGQYDEEKEKKVVDEAVGSTESRRKSLALEDNEDAGSEEAKQVQYPKRTSSLCHADQVMSIPQRGSTEAQLHALDLQTPDRRASTSSAASSLPASQDQPPLVSYNRPVSHIRASNIQTQNISDTTAEPTCRTVSESDPNNSTIVASASPKPASHAQPFGEYDDSDTRLEAVDPAARNSRSKLSISNSKKRKSDDDDAPYKRNKGFDERDSEGGSKAEKAWDFGGNTIGAANSSIKNSKRGKVGHGSSSKTVKESGTIKTNAVVVESSSKREIGAESLMTKTTLKTLNVSNDSDDYAEVIELPAEPVFEPEPRPRLSLDSQPRELEPIYEEDVTTSFVVLNDEGEEGNNRTTAKATPARPSHRRMHSASNSPSKQYARVSRSSSPNKGYEWSSSPSKISETVGQGLGHENVSPPPNEKCSTPALVVDEVVSTISVGDVPLAAKTSAGIATESTHGPANVPRGGNQNQWEWPEDIF